MVADKRPRVAIALSGGVDSAVSAALLKQEGYAVVAIFAKTWTSQPGDGTTCTWVADRRDALRVAAHLDIPLVTLDLEETYRREIASALFNGYAHGSTPNPDTLCNRIIKFGGIYQAARQLGCDFFATGHYARIQTSKQETINRKQNRDKTSPRILRGIDPNKDQSYFLWDIPATVLPSVLFPIGGYTKAEVRQLAIDFGLPVATKKDSQGICFLGETDIQSFLATGITEQTGGIVDVTTGEQVGTHTGVFHFTVGQRQGLALAARAPVSEPSFVLKLDPKTQTVWVGPRSLLYQQSLRADQPNWLASDFPAKLQTGPARVFAQIRYRQTPQPASLEIDGDQLQVTFPEPVYAPTPGQSIVFYTDDQLLGGAVISK